MGEKEPPLQSLLEQHQKTDRALGKIAMVIIPLLDRRIGDTAGLSGEVYIDRALRTGRVRQALLERAQPTLLARKGTLEEEIRLRMQRLDGEVAEIGQLVEAGHLPDVALKNAQEILASFRRDSGFQESVEPPPEGTVFRAPAALHREPLSQQTDTVQLPEWVLEAVNNEGPLIFRGRDLTSDFERAPVSLRAMRIFAQTSRERPVARSVLARAVYPGASKLKVVMSRFSVLCCNSVNPKLYELGLKIESIFSQEGDQIGETHYYLMERSADGSSGEEVHPAVESFSADGHEPQTVFEAAAAPPSPAGAIAREESEFEVPSDQELFLVACALKSKAFISSTGGRLSSREYERLEIIVKEKKEQVVIPEDDLEALVLQTASRLPVYQAQMQEMIARFGKNDYRIFVLSVLFNQLHGGRKPDDLFLEIIDGMTPGRVSKKEACQEDFTDEQERVAYALFALNPGRTRFLSFAEIVKVAYLDRLSKIAGETVREQEIKRLRGRDFVSAQNAVIEQLRRVKLNSADVSLRVAKLLSWLKEQPEYRNVALDDLILVAEREILFKDFQEKAGLRNAVFSGTAS